MSCIEIWTRLYDRRIHDAGLELSIEQENLFYFIDMVYYVENGGAGGFLYNMSPATAIDNNYTPYIQCLTFFGHLQVAESLKKYNALYVEAIKLFNTDSGAGFEAILKTYVLPDFERKLEESIAAVVADQEKILRWIDANKVELQHRLLQ